VFYNMFWKLQSFLVNPNAMFVGGEDLTFDAFTKVGPVTN
jgi:hypothetical protein